MKIKKLVKDLEITVKGSKDLEVTGISNNSKLVCPGDLFIAKKGSSFDGNDFISDAISAGAIAIVTDLYNPFLQNITQLIAPDVAKIESLLAMRFYEDPSHDLYMTGITGTAGKTTTTYILHHLLEVNNPTGLLGTIETIMGDHRKQSSLTTPDCITVQKTLKEMMTKGLSHVVMEVSSHALDQNRVQNVCYDQAIFLNLSPEHLDYHNTMEEYAAAKKKLFQLLKHGGVAILNGDSTWAKTMMDLDLTYTTFGLSESNNFYATDIEYSLQKTNFTFHTPDGSIEIETPFIGRYNVVNTLAALTAAYLQGISLEVLKERLQTVAQIPGRMERVLPEQNIFVDYAHKPEALEQVLKAMQPFKTGKVTVLFGCGGERDTQKRSLMAEVAEKYADHVIVTSDNPRREDPKSIIQEILKGFNADRFSVIEDRRQAIHAAITLTDDTDILIIAGKGHEKVQILGTKSVPFDDVEVAKELVNVLI